jgi:integrase
MARRTTGSVFKTADGYGIRWPEDGKRPQRAGFATKTEARRWFAANVAPRLDRGGPSPDITLDAFCELFLERHGATVSARTRATLEQRLAPARDAFGDWTLAELEHAADDVAAWRAKLPEGGRHRHTKALRQALTAAVRWRKITRNPAIDIGRNPAPSRPELDPFTPAELDAIVAELDARGAALVVFAAETGLRTHEWIAAERRDVDRAGPAVAVSRRIVDGALTPYPKTDRSRRRVPLSDRALAALDGLPPRLDSPYLFPAERGGAIRLDNWRTREWYPALDAAGIRRRGPYHLRHTFATEALAAGMPTFLLARVMGCSLQMIDKHYGHLAHDSEDAARALLNARAVDERYGYGKQ